MPVREYDNCECYNSHQNRSHSGAGREPWVLQDSDRGWWYVYQSKLHCYVAKAWAVYNAQRWPVLKLCNSWLFLG